MQELRLVINQFNRSHPTGCARTNLDLAFTDLSFFHVVQHIGNTFSLDVQRSEGVGNMVGDVVRDGFEDKCAFLDCEGVLRFAFDCLGW